MFTQTMKTVINHRHTHTHLLKAWCVCVCVYVCRGKVRSLTPSAFPFFFVVVLVQNADSALQAVPEATFAQEAPLRLQPQDRGRPSADGEEVAHCQVTAKKPGQHLAVASVQ